MFKLTNDLFNVGVFDGEIDFFEGQYKVPAGVTYNSYLLIDGKTAVFDTVDCRFCGEWLKNLEKALQGKTPDYLIMQHVEPDHSACICEFLAKYPAATVVGSSKTFVMAEQYFGKDFAPNRLVINDGDALSLGRHELTFVFAPMVHWPEVFFTYDRTACTLFSADAFGKFGDSVYTDDWAEEARRYYIGIVGKYGLQVQSALKKAAALKIDAVAPLHGPFLQGGQVAKAVAHYSVWSSYQPEKKGVAIACASVYGHTFAACKALKERLEKAGAEVVLLDLVRDDFSQCVAMAFKYSALVLASVTYNADVFPVMKAYLDGLAERGFKNRKVGFVENGSWAPLSAKKMKEKLEGCKNLEFIEPVVTVRAALDGRSGEEVSALAAILSEEK